MWQGDGANDLNGLERKDSKTSLHCAKGHWSQQQFGGLKQQ